MCVNLKEGYLFRALNRKSEISEDPFVGSAIANRLTLHLSSAGIYDRERMHSFRSGCSITLSLLGVVFYHNSRLLFTNRQGNEFGFSRYFSGHEHSPKSNRGVTACFCGHSGFPYEK